MNKIPNEKDVIFLLFSWKKNNKIFKIWVAIQN